MKQQSDHLQACSDTFKQYPLGDLVCESWSGKSLRGGEQCCKLEYRVNHFQQCRSHTVLDIVANHQWDSICWTQLCQNHAFNSHIQFPTFKHYCWKSKPVLLIKSRDLSLDKHLLILDTYFALIGKIHFLTTCAWIWILASSRIRRQLGNEATGKNEETRTMCLASPNHLSVYLGLVTPFLCNPCR